MITVVTILLFLVAGIILANKQLTDNVPRIEDQLTPGMHNRWGLIKFVTIAATGITAFCIEWHFTGLNLWRIPMITAGAIGTAAMNSLMFRRWLNEEMPTWSLNYIGSTSVYDRFWIRRRTKYADAWIKQNHQHKYKHDRDYATAVHEAERSCARWEVSAAIVGFVITAL